jgi:dihydroorotase
MAEWIAVMGGDVWDGNVASPADLLVHDGVVVTRAPRGGIGALPEGAAVLDARGAFVLPGLVDLHVHLREPGDEEAETVASGSAAAAAGGFTDVVAMPNTVPPLDTAARVGADRAAAAAAGLCRVHPAGCVTRGRNGKSLSDMRELVGAGVRIFTDDGDPVSDPLLMRRALEYAGALGAVVADHCEDRSLTVGAQMHEGELSGRLGMPGWPAVAEEIVVARDVLLSEATGARVHIQHISTAGSVRILADAKARGVPVTAEATPHHLTLTDAEAASFDPRFKVNPPLRAQPHVDAVRAGLAEGVIDAVATDHAPHTAENKEEWSIARCGMLGLETALPLLWGLVRDGILSAGRLVDAMATRPAAIAGLGGRGALTEGCAADLCVFDPDATWTVEASGLHSRSSNTPYAGMNLTGRVRHTVLAGRITLRDCVVQAGAVLTGRQSSL